jgi:hypothetical protein
VLVEDAPFWDSPKLTKRTTWGAAELKAAPLN